MASQAVITLPAFLLIMLGIGTFAGLIYLLCYKMDKEMTAADLTTHKQYWKWMTSVALILGGIIMMYVCINFYIYCICYKNLVVKVKLHGNSTDRKNWFRFHQTANFIAMFVYITVSFLFFIAVVATVL